MYYFLIFAKLVIFLKIKAFVWACLFLPLPPFPLEVGPRDSDTWAVITPFLSLPARPFSQMLAPLLEGDLR